MSLAERIQSLHESLKSNYPHYTFEIAMDTVRSIVRDARVEEAEWWESHSASRPACIERLKRLKSGGV